jgi:hypothetical protein
VDAASTKHSFRYFDTENLFEISKTNAVVSYVDININSGCKLNTPGILLNGVNLATTIANLASLKVSQTFDGPKNTFQTIVANEFNVTSDYRIKENIKPLDKTFTIDKLKPVHYFNKINKREDIGIIAHELQEEYPFLVMGEKDGESYQNVNYNGLFGILIREIQELKARIIVLESQKDRKLSSFTSRITKKK